MDDKAGTWKTNRSGGVAYKSFLAATLRFNLETTLDSTTVNMLVAANKQLALLDGLLLRIPNSKPLVSMYVYKEALLSSQIDGIKVNLDDILDPLPNENTNRNAVNVINYIKATEFAIGHLKDMSLCTRLIKETHAVLMEGACSQEESPGEFRRSHNWISRQGSSFRTANYIPPSPADIANAMSELEYYMNRDVLFGDLNVLVRAAIIHCNFQVIHPFLDGNDRIGRLLVTLFLMEKHTLTMPALYISYSLKRNRTQYYDCMKFAMESGKYELWVNFFLEAVRESAEDAIATTDKLVVLRDKNTAIINSMGRSEKTALRVFRYLEENPIIDIQKTAMALETSYNAIAGAVKRLCDTGILVQTTGQQRNRTFAYEAYLDILRSVT